MSTQLGIEDKPETKNRVINQSINFNGIQRLHAEQVRQLYKHTPIGVVATLVNSLILTFILWKVIPSLILTTWFAVSVLVAFFRYLLFLKFWRSAQTQTEFRKQEIWFNISIAFSGILWGSTGIFLLPIDSVSHQIFIAFVLGGMVAGAAGTFSIFLRTFLIYSLPTLVPIVIRFFVIGGHLHVAMGGMTLLFGLLMYLTAIRVNTAIVSSIKLKFENIDLIDQLEQRIKQRTAELEEVNERLKRKIKERMEVDIALRESKDRYTLATSAARVGVWDWNIKTGKFYLDPSIKAILGYNDEEIPNDLESWATYIHPDDKQPVMKTFQDHIKGKTPEYVFEHRMLHKDNSIRWIFVRGTAIRDAQGNAVRVVGTDADITDLKQAQEALRNSEEKLRNIVKNAIVGIYQVTLEGNFVLVNPSLAQMFGFNSPEEFLTSIKNISKLYVNPEERSHILKTIENRGFVDGVEIQFMHRDGHIIWARKSAQAIEDKTQGTLCEGFMVDITAHKQAEEEKRIMDAQLQQFQKMEAIGTLAGGIAHDFNNLLMGIQGRASLMSLDLEPSHPNSVHINAIEEHVKSAAELTKQLLGFARGGKYEVRPIDINEVLVGSATMFGRAKKEIRIHTKLQKPPPVVMADRRQIEQVLLNLYVNAWQAMPDSGDLYLETKLATLDDTYCKPYQANPGRYVKVSIKDTGIGIDESIRHRIFDPFFTTKDKGRGTGLGLASAYGIIKGHAGIITVDSEVGYGTTFNIYLPVSDQKVYREDTLEAALIKGSETILLVDDEEMIVDVGKAMLEKLGYRVVVAKSGGQAVHTIKMNGDGIDLVILDLIMPGIEGGKAFDIIHEIRPKMPVLLSSGYSLNDQANDIMRRGSKGFLQKPFNIYELSKTVRKIIDETKSPVKD
jgi:PAS domain S-box-containing protein